MKYRHIHVFLLLFAFLVSGQSLKAQIQVGDDLSEVDYSSPKEYEIGGIVVEGAKYVDGSMLAMIAGLNVGNTITIPGEDDGEEENFWAEETETHTATAVTVTTSAANIPLEMPAITFAGVEGYVAGNNVRMRSAPSMSAPIVGEVSYGNALNIVGRTGDWAAAICGDKAGYIYGQFVKLGSLNLTPQTGSVDAGGGVSAPVYLGGSSLEKGQ